MPLHHSSETILSHPGLSAARLAYVEAVLRLYEHDTSSNRLLVEATRGVVFFVIVSLYFAYEQEHRSSWPTMRLLKETVGLFGLSSDRRVDAIVSLLVKQGFIISEPAATDRRARILAPTEKGLLHDREWLAANYAPLSTMFPDPGYSPAMRRDPAFHRAQRIVARTMAAQGADIMATNPAIMFFMARDAGIMILFKLIDLADASGSATFSSTDLGKRFGISRTHVRNLLRDAQAANLVSLADGVVVLSVELLSAFDRFMASGMSGHDLIFRQAISMLADPREPPRRSPPG